MLLQFFLVTTIYVLTFVDAAPLGHCNFRDLPSTLYNNPSTGSSIEIPTGTRLKVNCRQEYKEGNHSITCQNSGWSEVEPPCEKVYCPYEGHPPEGYLNMPCRGYNCTIIYTCNLGFWYNGTLPRVCQRNEQWTGSIGTCEAVLCPELPDPPHGKMDQGDRSYNTRATVVCDEGYIYTKPDLNMRQCRGNNTWTEPGEGECKEIQCPDIEVPKNGRIHQLNWKYLSNATTVCDEGFIYTKPDSIVRRCQRDETWSGQEGRCEGVRCPQLPNIEHGKVSSQTGQFKESVMLQCESGYAISGQGTVTCEANRQWSARLGTCDIQTQEIKSKDHVVPIVIPIVVVLVIVTAAGGIFLWFYYIKPKRARSSAICEGEEGIKLIGMRRAEWWKLHCSFSLTDDLSREYSGIETPEYGLFSSLVKKEVAVIMKKKADITVDVENVKLIKKNNRVFLDILSGKELPEEKVSDAIKELVIKSGKFYYHVDPDTVVFRERAIHNLVADIQAKMHRPDKKLDKSIDLDTQYVRLKMLSHKKLGAMYTDTREDRPDLYQEGLEKHGGKDIDDEDLIEDIHKDKYILIRGRAGIGKSTLVQRLLWKWANGEWASHLKGVFMLNLRYLMTVDKVMDLPRLISLYGVYNTGNADVMFDLKWLKENENNIGIILDGIDEISNFKEIWEKEEPATAQELLKPMQWCFLLLKRRALKGSTLLISSRPFADLRIINSLMRGKVKIVELMGLTSTRVMEFVNKNVVEHQRRMVEDKLQRNPILLSVCAITFYCAALCQVLSEEGDLPLRLKTYTQITAYIMQMYMRRSAQNGEGISLTEFYNSIKGTLKLLSKLASDGLLNHGPNEPPRLMFDEDNFTKLQDKVASDGMKKIGLLMETDTSNPDSPDKSTVISQFVHLSIQEFLAMAMLLNETPQQVETTLKRLCKSGHFNMAFLFLYGLAFNDDYGPVRNITSAVSEDPEVREEVKDILLNGVKHIPREKALQALQIAHESQSKDVAREVGRTQFEREIFLQNTKLTVIDILAMSFLFKHHPSIESVKLERVGLDRVSMQKIARCLVKYGSIKTLELVDDNIEDNCITILMDKIHNNKSLLMLTLASDDVTDNGMGSIASTIETNTSLQVLSLTFGKVCDNGVQELAKALKSNDTLTELSLSFPKMTDKAVDCIAEAIPHAENLAMLSLHTESITDKAVTSVCEAARKSKMLKDLGIKSNCITDAGVVQAAGLLKGTITLKTLRLSGFHMKDDGGSAILVMLRDTPELTVRIWPPSCDKDLYRQIDEEDKITFCD